MVAGALILARCFVYGARYGLWLECVADQDVIDAQAAVAAEARIAVIPPRVVFGRLCKQAYAVV